MLDLGWSEIILLGVLVLLVMGPKQLPGTLRMLGRIIGRLKRNMEQFRDSIEEMVEEEENNISDSLPKLEEKPKPKSSKNKDTRS
ncbi:MAG: Sec-independent protein translocase protein TatB [Parvibaculales bacterium]